MSSAAIAAIVLFTLSTSQALVNFTEPQIETIVNVHNQLRQQVAAGNVSNGWNELEQPAANMQKLVCEEFRYQK